MSETERYANPITQLDMAVLPVNDPVNLTSDSLASTTHRRFYR